MKIREIRARHLQIPLEVDVLGPAHEVRRSVCYVEVKTDCGIVGHGVTAITHAGVVATAINEVVAPAILNLDPMNHEALWQKMYWLLSPRGQTGISGHAIAALDTAFWDIKGKSLQQPIWKLLGGARDKVQLYTTFGFHELDCEKLVDAAQRWKAKGHTRLKMEVSYQAIQRRDSGAPVMATIREDARRIRAVREAIGADAELSIDANCSLDLLHALQLANWVDDCDLAYFEEPITQNDIRQMLELKRRTGMLIAAGQNEALLFRYRDMIDAGAVDLVQPNCVLGGGFTQCVKVAAYAEAHNLPILNGGGWPFHNMHLHAGLANGSLVEYHHLFVLASEQIFQGLPEPVAGYIQLPVAPGLGFEPRLDAIEEFTV
ncbi:mandelate racemase/muconate lactonizing enzyme family protein [Hydrogenophaga sp. BPS33]|uniref:mandelate racemase/muconate lactonizing enzyme family protein n=1 Tax=Hydrogenophaga sp. BPS33 TaxID=2651974 RepID=UPI0013200454|nr:mandelate racemase/muconate lactonizing enzyme family protein [Hydrogenophaga sp. BPS33]QHE84676.1 mandelate racemase/muconate lactonizing enzyme family protein [Hydrogenophaga sp. BPS33]